MSTRGRGKPRKPGKGERVAKRSVVGAAEREPAGASVSPATEFLLDEDLTPQQRVFVEELCANPTRPVVDAVRKAYPDQTPEVQRSTATENMDKPHIIAAIRRRLAPALRKTRTSRDRVLQLLGDSLDADRRAIIGPDGAILPFRDWPPEVARLCTGFDQEEITVGGIAVGRTLKPRFTDFLTTLQIAAKVNKMLVDKVEHSDDGIAERLKRAEERLARRAS